MSLEYSSTLGNERYNPPNPVRLQNRFLIAGGALFLLLGLILMFAVRRGAAQMDTGALGGILVGAAMVIVGIAVLAWAFSHLRFWFGRERPVNLDGGRLRELMRQRALEFDEPSGPINGLLYSWIHDLIYAPAPIQGLAQWQFQNALTMAALLGSLVLGLLAGRSVVGESAWEGVSQWMGVIYLAFAFKLLLSGTGMNGDGKAAIGRGTLAGLIVFAVVGPVLLSFAGALLPPLPWSPYPHVFVLLIVALLLYGLFFFALLRQANTPPQTEVSCEQEAWSFNCQPALIMGELDRHLQSNWTNQIPNRRYLRSDPKIDITRPSGDFWGEVLEETQPVPMPRKEQTLAGAWADERSKLLLVLDAVGLFCLSTSAGALTWFGLQTGHTDFGIGGLVEGVILLSLGYFAFRSSHALWKRFDFDSLVIWVEMEGSYVSANIEHGNIMHDTIKTKSNVVQIQSMTFRLWIARVSSVTFGVKTQRYVVNMAGEPDYAAALAGQLRNFARSRAMILAPTSQSDIENHVALDHLNRLSRPLQEGSKDNAVALPVESGFGENALLPLDNAGLDAPCKTLAARYCSQCGSGVALADLFCQSCGNHLKPV